MSLISDYQAAALARACVAFWPLDDASGASTAADAGPHGTTATATGSGASAASMTGPDGTASVWGFSGGDYLTLADSSHIPTGAAAFSIDALFLVGTPHDTDTGGILGYGTSATPLASSALGLSINTGTGVEHDFSVGGSLSYDQPGATFGGTWHQASVTWDGTTRTLYVDGTQVAQDTPTGVNVVLADTPTIAAVLAAGYTLTGGLCCVGLYSECLPSGFIASQYALVTAATPAAAVAGPTIGTTRSSGIAVGYAGTVPPRTVQIVDVYRNGSATPQAGAYVRARLPNVAPTATYRTTGGVVLRPVSDTVVTDSFGNYRLPLIPPGDIIPTGQPYIVEFSRKADFSVVDVVVETTSFGYMAGDHPLSDVLPTDSIGTRVLAVVDLRDCSGTALVGQLVTVRPLVQAVVVSTGALIGVRNAAASAVVDNTARATFLLYPSSGLNPPQPYILTASVLTDLITFRVPDSGGNVTATILPGPVTPGVISASEGEIAAGDGLAVPNSSPATLADEIGDLRYRIQQAAATAGAAESGGAHRMDLSTATTTSAAATKLCWLHVVGTGGTLGAMTFYDGPDATGTALFSVTPSAGDHLSYQLPLTSGHLTVVTAAATTAIVTYD